MSYFEHERIDLFAHIFIGQQRAARARGGTLQQQIEKGQPLATSQTITLCFRSIALPCVLLVQCTSPLLNNLSQEG